MARRRRRRTAARRRSICNPRKMIEPAAARRRADPRRPRHDRQPRLRRKRRPRWRPQLLQDGSAGGDRDGGTTVLQGQVPRLTGGERPRQVGHGSATGGSALMRKAAMGIAG
jgi:hypothetical protein